MMDLSTMDRLNRDAALNAAADNRQPFLITAADKAAAMGGNFNTWNIPNLGDYVPPGWRRVSLSDKIGYRGYDRGLDAFWVDSSGMGAADEPALTLNQFAAVLESGKGYAVVSAGEFQLYVGVYERVPTAVLDTPKWPEGCDRDDPSVEGGYGLPDDAA